MAQPTLVGAPFSTFVRTARLALEEKGVAYTLQPLTAEEVFAGALAAHHPLARMPVLRHGDLRLMETLAIVSYVDDAFSGPRLIPEAALPRARVLQWVSMVADYLVPDLLRGFMVPAGLAPDTLDTAALPKRLAQAERVLTVLEDGHEGASPWMVGDSLTAADLFLLPIVAYLPRFPQTASMMERLPKLRGALEALAARPSFAATRATRA